MLGCLFLFFNQRNQFHQFINQIKLFWFGLNWIVNWLLMKKEERAAPAPHPPNQPPNQLKKVNFLYWLVNWFVVSSAPASFHSIILQFFSWFYQINSKNFTIIPFHSQTIAASAAANQINSLFSFSKRKDEIDFGFADGLRLDWFIHKSKIK